MNVGIFLHFDFTLNGMLFNELRCYNAIFKDPAIEKIYVFDFKGKFGTLLLDFDFEFTRVIVSSPDDVDKFRKVDVIFTWDWYQDFYAGVIGKKPVMIYKIFSKLTNEVGTRIYFRICDSTHYMKDYKRMIAEKAAQGETGRKFAERNAEMYHSLDDIPFVDYTNSYFLCNGSRKVCDWSWVTLGQSMPFIPKEDIQRKTLYLSDDILFRYTEFYEKMSYLASTEKEMKLYHVGNMNLKKSKRIRDITKKTSLPIVVRTSQNFTTTGLKKFPNLHLEEEPIFRDEMYTELNKYHAYLFVGKGDDYSYYFNKTLYDASIARTVFLIYGKIDTGNLYHELSDYVFNDEVELMQKFEWIKEDYQKHLEFQREVLISNLSDETFSFLDPEYIGKESRNEISDVPRISV
jgi:hypothetical protein